MQLRVIDSHTGGEPTRFAIDRIIEQSNVPVAEVPRILRENYDHFRRGMILEPRGYDWLVGAALVDPDPGTDFGVVFFNNVGYLGMCGHGLIGVVESLRFLGRVSAGNYRFSTPVGTVNIELAQDGSVSFENVVSFRHQKQVSLKLSSGEVTGDIAFGGNWFFICEDHDEDIELSNLSRLHALSKEILETLHQQGITGHAGAEIDHVELVGTSTNANSRNFVLCPGGEYDRSPCGTGTSAKIACLASDGKLLEGQLWRQESITGSVFTGSVRKSEQGWLPRISGRAFVTADSTLHFDADDPLIWGVPQ